VNELSDELGSSVLLPNRISASRSNESKTSAEHCPRSAEASERAGQVALGAASVRRSVLRKVRSGNISEDSRLGASSIHTLVNDLIVAGSERFNTLNESSSKLTSSSIA